MEEKTFVNIYTDGACSGNPGPGGWGAILLYGEHRKELSGGEAETTNNRMELTAAIQALQALKRPCQVDLHTDSTYLRNAFEQGWLVKWQKNGWRTAAKEPVLNRDLWETLWELTQTHRVRRHWVKGHADDELNNRCDALVRRAREEFGA